MLKKKSEYEKIIKNVPPIVSSQQPPTPLPLASKAIVIVSSRVTGHQNEIEGVNNVVRGWLM